MKKIISSFFFLLIFIQGNAQIEVGKIIGKNSDDYGIGFGAFLKFAFPASDASAITAEVGLKIFTEKEYKEYGVIYIPVKVGYRYTLNGSGTGFYVEPQVGYNVSGVRSYYSYEEGKDIDEKLNGFVWAAGAGYLFEPGNKIQFDLSVRYESVVYKNGPLNNISLRLAHNITFGRRD